MPDPDHPYYCATDLVVDILWFLVCLVTLGFPAKYRERLRLFETLFSPQDPQAYWATEATFSDRGSNEKDDQQKTMRQKQQVSGIGASGISVEEWDRLNIAVSVITATSAAALAIQAASQQIKVYWLVTAFYSIAFGLSLQGLILITYITVTAGGSSDEAIWRLATGTLLSDNPKFQVIKPTAFIMALPAILATYSSISLLLGLVAMVVSGQWDGVDTRRRQYIIVTLVPVGLTFVSLCVAIAVCELGSWIEIWGRRKYLREHGRYLPSSSNTGSSTGLTPSVPMGQMQSWSDSTRSPTPLSTPLTSVFRTSPPQTSFMLTWKGAILS